VLFTTRGHLGGRGGCLGVESNEVITQFTTLPIRSPKYGIEFTATRLKYAEAIGVKGATNVAQFGVNVGKVASGGSLTFQRSHLTTHFTHEVTQSLQVLLSLSQATLGPLLTAAVLKDSGGLFNNGAAVFTTRVEDRVELTLPDDHVLLATNARVAQEFLDVEQSTRAAVDGVFTVAITKEGSRDSDFSALNRETAVGVVECQRYFGASECGAIGRTSEDDVFHLSRAQSTSTLGPEDPSDGVDDVGLARTVGSDHGRYARFEFECGGVSEGLKTLHSEALQKHRTTLPIFTWELPGFGRPTHDRL